jgi:anaerobic dimethyl sulfoxide reductase subunit B (iron-sulfur subunit)
MPQYGWHINVDNCIGCRACETACKQEYLLPAGVKRRLVVVQEGTSRGRPYRQHVTMACMHCDRPACAIACPVGRYFKDDAENAAARAAFGMSANPETGLVLIKPSKAEDPVNGVDCIGCKRCIAACPYGAPQFDEASGTVDKCTGCYHRLHNPNLPVERRRPSCVLTCSALTLSFADMTSIVAGAFGATSLTTGAPAGACEIADPSLTGPNVRFTPQQNIP